MTRKISRRAAVVVVAVGALLAAAGCAADDGAAGPGASHGASSVGPSGAGSPTPSPAASRVVVKPARPASMDDDGAVGAQAAAVYFLELDSYMQASGDTAEWEAMSHAECDYCAARSKQAKEIRESKYVWNGGSTTAAVLHTYVQDPTTGIWPVDIEVTDPPSKVSAPDGKVVFSSEREQYTRRVEVARRDGTWVIVGVAKEK
ncbi:MAG: DUF6318 family protein [Promicromonosporaceae bacterium]|nr:DUF6318 family protein [Promicromonosporaceae bacterium]